MATTSIGFRWLDILEKEFDKACVELDTSLLDAEPEEPEVVCAARQKISTLSSCFSQLTHKALTIFQHSAKLEAELVDMRAELVQTRAALAKSESPLSSSYSGISDALRTRAEAAQFAKENAVLRETILALYSELFGARLATKYLDKELAGRIQQLQLLGRDMRADIRDSLWAQVEAEILLQRHKSLVRVCRGVAPSPRAPRPAPHAPRTVTVRRSPHLGLGISVTGGREHGVPILISELEADGPAALTGELCVGDAILAINELDLTQACHKDAVKALQSVKGDCALCVQFIATDDDDKLSEDNYRFPLYPEDEEVFCRDMDGRGATPTAPRTPDYNHRPPSDVESVTDFDPHYASPTFPPPRHPYPDYNALNNNLNIVDMDDHSIEVETEPSTLTVKPLNEVRRNSKTYVTKTAIDHSRTHFDQQRPVIEQQRSVIDPQRSVTDPQQYVIDLQRTMMDPQQFVLDQQRSVIEQRPVMETQKSINDTQKIPETQKSELQRSVKDSGNAIVQTQISVIEPFYKDTSRCLIEPRALNTPYAPIYRFQSSSASPPSTPVHEPRNIKKKKVKSHDWRIKGAYRAIEDDDSSDDTQKSTQKPVNGSVLPADKEIAQTKQIETQNVPIKQLVSIEKSVEPARSIPPLPPPSEVLPQRNSKKITLPNNPIQAKLVKNKGFRIGSAKRISETPLTNGNSQNSNGVKDYQSQIISGDGDPDFGTPV